jgi:hypothetical protein
MHSMFFSRETVGEGIYIFTEDMKLLSDLASLHSLQPRDYRGVDQIWAAILSHVLLGDCFRSAQSDAVHAPPILSSCPTCCSCVSHSYVSG